MINVNEEVKQAYRNFGSTKNINIVMKDKNNYITTYLSMNDIVGNTFSFEQILEPTNNLTFTGCNASVLKFRAKNTDISQFEGGYIMVFLGAEVDEESYEYINIFHGIIDSIKNTTPMQASMDVVAYDLMYYINKLDVTSWYDTLPFTSGYEQCLPLTAIKGSLFTEISNRVRTKYNVNIQFADYSMPSDSIYFPKNIDDEHVYAGDVLRWICQLNGRYAQMSGISCYFLQLKKNSLYPSATLYPSSGLYPGGMSAQENIPSASYKMGSLDIEKYTTAPIDGVQIIDKDNHQIAYAGENAPLNIFTVNGNPFVYNLEQSKLDTIANNLYEAIQGIYYIPLKFDMIGLPYLECGDYINIQVGNTMKSTYILHRILSGEQALTDRIETKGDEYLPIFKPNTDDKIREAISKAKSETRQMITEYDIAVQIMNDLAVNAIGGYIDYEEAESGGRIYYLSNRPITKNAQGECVFEIGSTVFMSSGDGLYVSLDGGTTWINGYNATTGRLVVNVLNAIGISADWIKTGKMIADRIRGGTLLIGGVDNTEGRILACNNDSKILRDSKFNGISEELFLFGEGSNLPYIANESYATCDLYHYMTQPVYYNEYLDGDTPLAYFRGIIGNDPDDWQERRAYVTTYTQPVYGVTYYKGSSISLLLLSTASFKGKIKTTMSPSRGSTETESTFISSSVQPSQTYPFPSTVYYYNVTDTSRGLDSDHIDPEPSTTSASVTENTMRLELSYIVLFGEHHRAGFDLDWYFWDDDYDGYDYDGVHYDGLYYDEGTKLYANTNVKITGIYYNAYTYSVNVPDGVICIVTNFKYYDSSTEYFYLTFIFVGNPNEYMPEIIVHYTDSSGEHDRRPNRYPLNLSNLTDKVAYYAYDGPFLSCDAKISDVLFATSSVALVENTKHLCAELGTVMIWGDEHIPDPALFIPTESTILSMNVSNISDSSAYEGLYQIYQTEDAGETFTQVGEDYLKEDDNFIDYTFEIDENEINTKYYKLLLTRSETTFNATYDYKLKRLVFTTEIDGEGIKTNNGTFGILKIDNTDSNDTKLIIPKDSNVLYEEDYTNYNKHIKGSFRFSPYQLIWTQDATLAVDFSSTVTYGATENRYSCKVKLVKVDANNTTSHTINTFALDSKGKIFSGAHAGEDPVFSELIDHEWGKNPGEYYIFGYTIYMRSFSTGDNAHIKLFDANNSAQVGTVISKDNIMSNFIGNFSGYGNLNALEINGTFEIGDWTFNEQAQRMEIISDSDEPSDYADTYYGKGVLKLCYDGNYMLVNYNSIHLYQNASNVTDEKYLNFSRGLYQRYVSGDDSYYTELTHSEFNMYWSGLTLLQETIMQEMFVRPNDITRRETIGFITTDYGLTWTTSDERVKEDIENLDVMLSKQLIDRTQPKKFKYKGTDGKHYGMIAQDARKVLDELGEGDSKLEHSMNIPKERAVIDDQRTIDYQEYIPHLINYVKELKAEIDSLKEEIKTLKGE